MPSITIECSSFHVEVLPNGRISLELNGVKKEDPTDKHDTLYDKQGAAKRLGTSVRSIDNYMRQMLSPLPFTKIGGLVRFRESDLQLWLDGGLSLSARRARQRAGSTICEKA